MNVQSFTLRPRYITNFSNSVTVKKRISAQKHVCQGLHFKNFHAIVVAFAATAIEATRKLMNGKLYIEVPW